MKLIKKSANIIMPWKNGGGVTEQIDLDFNSHKELNYRLSKAQVQQDGPFSIFNDCKRLLIVIKGDGFYLNNTFLKPFEFFNFSGEENIYCRLKNNAVQDLGLIYNRSKYTCQAEMIHLDASTSKKSIHLNKGIHYLFAASEDFSVLVSLNSSQHNAFILESEDTLKITEKCEIQACSKTQGKNFFILISLNEIEVEIQNENKKSQGGKPWLFKRGITFFINL